MSTAAESALLELLANKEAAPIVPALRALDALPLASLYVSVAFLRSALDFIGEQWWLSGQKGGVKPEYPELIRPFLSAELAPLAFLHKFLSASSSLEAKALRARARAIEAVAIETMIERPLADRKLFAKEALRLIDPLFALETRLQDLNARQGTHLGISLYRTFDSLDELFGLNYALEKNRAVDPLEPERLYEGAGVGVQSGCSTVLTALRHLGAKENARFIDLGSGYGRVGLLVGLMRPDLDFIGYEFVPERVAVANKAAENLAMSAHVRFLTQDLSAPSFQIPPAEIYYLYDPFNESTYRHVISQLVDLSKCMEIVIVTKGNASRWLGSVAQEQGWPVAEEHDSGNLRIYRAKVQ